MLGNGFGGGYGSLAGYGRGYAQVTYQSALLVELPSDSTAHSHTVTSPVITQSHNLTVADTTHTHTVTSIDVTQLHNLSAQNAAHSVASDNIDIIYAILILLDAPDSAHHSTKSDTFWLPQNNILQAENTTHDTYSYNSRIINWDKLSVGFGRYRQGYGLSGGLEGSDKLEGRIRYGYGDTGQLEDIDGRESGRYREKYKNNGEL